MHAAARFLQEFFARSSAPVCIASFANERGKLKPIDIYTRDLEAAVRFVVKYDKPGRAIYFGVNPIIEGKTRSKENIAEITALFADLDFKGIVESRVEIEAVLARLRTSCIVFSGNGLHPYWFIQATPPALKDRVEAALKRLAWALAGDPAVCEVARVMRLPGSHNSKNDSWTEVEVIHKNDVSYELEQLEQWLDGIKEPLLHRTGEARKGNGSGLVSVSPLAALAEAVTIPEPINVDQVWDEMQYHGSDGNGVNLTQWRVIGSLLHEGVAVDEAVNYVVAKTWELVPESASWSQKTEIDGVRDMCVRTFRNNPEHLDKQLSRPHWLERRLNGAGGEQQRELDEPTKKPEAQKLPLPVFEWISGEVLEQDDVEPVQWIVNDFIMRDVLNGIFGDGGVGKDYLLLQLAIAMSCDKPWLGKDVTPGKVMYFNVEDRRPSIRRRQDRILRYLNATHMKYPDRLRVVPMVGKSTILATFDSKSGLVQATPAMQSVRNMVEEYHPDLVIFGNRVNIFGVNQNEDSHARQCIELLNAISIDYATTLIMPGHVSIRGLSDDSGTSASGSSGTVQWSNGPRQRLLLSKAKKDNEEDNSNKRTLEVLKSNEAPTGITIDLHWSSEHFLYVADDEHLKIKPTALPTRDERDADIDKEVLRLLRSALRMKLKLGTSLHGSNSFAKWVSGRKECKYKDKPGLILASVERMITKRKIGLEQYGSPSHDTWKLVLLEEDNVVPFPAKT